jgi:hypothetical protein
MPQCLVRGVRSVELVATNLEQASRDKAPQRCGRPRLRGGPIKC